MDTTSIVVLSVVGAFILLVLIDGATHPAKRCGQCGRKLGPDHIPPDIRASARAAGLKRGPDWYVGPLYCPHYKPTLKLDDLALERGDGPTFVSPPTTEQQRSPE